MNKKKIIENLPIHILTITIVVLTFYFLEKVLSKFRFESLEDLNQAKVAVASFLGVLFTGIITLIGILIKNVIEQKQVVIKQQEENRLRLEASLKAIELLKDVRPSEVPSYQVSGAIVVLIELGLIETALRLTNSLWRQGILDASIALFVINVGLNDKNTNIKLSASLLIERNIDLIAKLRTETSMPFPWPKNIWNSKGNYECKQRLMTSLVLNLIIKPRCETPRAVISSTIFRLYEASKDKNKVTRANAEICLIPLLQDFKDSSGVVVRGEIVAFDDLRKAIDEKKKKLKSIKATNDFIEYSKQLQIWMNA